jgi:Tol biopolymer transport system component
MPIKALFRVVILGALVSACGHSAVSSATPAVRADSAVMFAPGIVSTGDVFASTFTPDGKTVVFTKFSPPKPMTLMASSLVDGRWTSPTTLPFSGTYRDLDPAFSPDGSRLYFSSGRPSGPSAADTATGVDTWYVDRRGDGWSAPARLPMPVNSSAADTYPSVTRRGTLYFDSFRSQPPKRLVYRAEGAGNGASREPELLSAVINADSGASNLFVDPDERFVVFGAVRPEGFGGVDLYISWRNRGEWTTPQNLGRAINSPAVEFCPFISRDGKTLYFTRITTSSDGRVERNVFMIPFDADRYQPKR